MNKIKLIKGFDSVKYERQQARREGNTTQVTEHIC